MSRFFNTAARGVFMQTRRASPLMTAAKPRISTSFAETTAKALGGSLGSMALGSSNPFATQSKLGGLDLATLLALDGLQVGNYDVGSR